MARPCLRALGVAGLLAATATITRAAPPQVLDLGGTWSLTAVADAAGRGLGGVVIPEPGPVPATVPGTVHTDLFAAGKIGDPFFRDNAHGVGWVSRTPWTYTRVFEPSAELLARDKIVIECDGLDTAATVTLNGRPLGRADNMFRTWTFDVKNVLCPGPNTLAVTFTPIQTYVDEFVAAARQSRQPAAGGNSNVRKALYGSGWDFCPRLATCGIYKPIRLLGYDAVRLAAVAIDSHVEVGNAGHVTVRPALSDRPPAGTQVRATVLLDGTPIRSQTTDAGRSVSLAVENPKLWWPNGMGERPLYDVRVELLDADGRVIDTAVRRTGFRDVRLVRPADRKPLHLVVNGRPIFARGANWVPPDMFLTRVTPQRQRQLLQDAVDVGMNMIRTWGGGAYEDNAFYDACDELGLLVWHDFKFACNAYPVFNAAFADNVRPEIAEQVTRLSPHPSIAVWCGNNEVEAIVHRFGMMRPQEYKLLFGDLVGGALKAILPHAEYVTGSPDEGDEHNWWVWHIGAEFEKYRESHGFMTEFGFQSFPSPATVEGFTDPADRDSVLSPVMKAHQHNGNGRGNAMILDQIARYFRPARDFEATLWLSQINQAYGLTMGIEHWRADWPRSSGALVWQLNDSAPAASWSMIDYRGRWKAAQYAMRRAFAPVLVTGVYDPKTDTLPLTICSDGSQPFTAKVAWQATDPGGHVLDHGDMHVNVPAGTTAVAASTPNLKTAVAKAGRENLIVWVDVSVGGDLIASNTFFAARFKQINLRKPELSVRVQPVVGTFDVTVDSAVPALYTWLEIDGDPDARFSDNFAHVRTGRSMIIRVTPSKPMDPPDFRKRLIVRSLFDTSAPTGAATLPTGEDSK